MSERHTGDIATVTRKTGWRTPDGRLGRPSPRRVPAKDVDHVIRSREAYDGWNVEALPRAPGARSQIPVGLHVCGDRTAHGGSRRTQQEAWRACASANASRANRNRFTIKTSKPAVKVSWQVTGVRHDAYADAHRIQVEVDKPPQERGRYLHPELFGAPAEQAIGYQAPDSTRAAEAQPLAVPPGLVTARLRSVPVPVVKAVLAQKVAPRK